MLPTGTMALTQPQAMKTWTSGAHIGESRQIVRPEGHVLHRPGRAGGGNANLRSFGLGASLRLNDQQVLALARRLDLDLAPPRRRADGRSRVPRLVIAQRPGVEVQAAAFQVDRLQLVLARGEGQVGHVRPAEGVRIAGVGQIA